MPGTREAAIARATQLFDSGTFRATLQELVAIPSTSQEEAHRPDLDRYLDGALRAWLERLGFAVTVHQNPRPALGPILTATRHEGDGLPTVITYGHGDTVRGLEDQWSPGLSPWTITEKDGKWYGRGVVDNKGQHALNLAALEAVLEERGRLGFNLKLVIETAEERGSGGLREFVAANKALLAADVLGGERNLAALERHVANVRVRNAGTIGGNLGTASPIGDMLPPLIVLGATVRLASRRGERTLPVEDFLRDYRRTALAEDEVIVSVFLPRPPPGWLFGVEKLSRRHDQDISAVTLAALLDVADGVVREARLAFGGMAATARRAPAAEAALRGRPFAEDSFAAAAEALGLDFSPLSDWRGSAEYRQAAAGGLLRRLFWRKAAQAVPYEVTSVPAPHAPVFAAGGC
ncbi:MAG: M20/M25/M40 family metallo-hydrolase [Elioraea tepidiphila]